MDDGRYLMGFSTVGRPGSTLDHISNGVHQSQIIQTGAPYTAQTHSNHNGLYAASEAGSRGSHPQLQLSYGAPVIQQQQQFTSQPVYYGSPVAQQETPAIQTVTHNPQFEYPAVQQQYSAYHKNLGDAGTGETAGYFKSTIPTASGTSTPHQLSGQAPTLSPEVQIETPPQVAGNSNVVSINVDGYSNVSVTDVSGPTREIPPVHPANVSSSQTTAAKSSKTNKQGVRQKGKAQGVNEAVDTPNTTATADKRKPKAARQAVSKQTADTTHVVKKKQLAPKQTVDKSNVTKRKNKPKKVDEDNVDESASSQKTGIDTKHVRRKPPITTQISLVSDPFVEQVQAARESQVNARVPPKKREKAIKVSQVSGKSEAYVLDKHEVNERRHSRLSTTEEPVDVVSRQKPSRVAVVDEAKRDQLPPPEHNAGSDYTHTRVRVLHVTEDGTLSIRQVDKNKKPVKNEYKTQMSSIQTQTDQTPELTHQEPSTVLSIPIQKLHSVPKSTSTGQTQTDSAQHSVVARIMDQEPERIILETVMPHVEEDSTEQVVWTAGATTGITRTPDIEGVGHGNTSNIKHEDISDNEASDVKDHTRKLTENIYATVIKPLGQESVMLVDDDGDDEDDEPELDENPPVPLKSDQAFEPIYSNKVMDTGTPAMNHDDVDEADLDDKELTQSELGACADIDASVDQDEEDPYTTISDLREDSIHTTSTHGTVTSSSTYTTEQSSTGSTDPDVGEAQSDRILRVAKERRQKGEVDVYENITLHPHGDGDVMSSDKQTTVKMSDRVSGGLAIDGVLRGPPTAQPAPSISTVVDKNAPISLPLGFRLNNAFNVYFHGCDITKLKVDVIVNAANSKLKHDHGVAKAIAKVAGKDLEQDSKKLIKKNGAVEVGDVVSTKPGKLQCAYVFHAVGPKYKDYKDKNACMNKLRETYDKVFETCMRHKVPSLAIPPISAGKFGVPEHFISACIHETLLAASTNPNYKYMKIIHVINIEPAIILPVAEALATRPALIRGMAVKVEPLDRRDVRRMLEQCVKRKKSSKQTTDSKKTSIDTKSAVGKKRGDGSDTKSAVGKTRGDGPKDGKRQSPKSSSGSNKK